jgi:hypothetical protein
MENIYILLSKFMILNLKSKSQELNKKAFEGLLNTLANKFKINVGFIYLFSKKGERIGSLDDIPWKENTIIISNF